MKRLSYVFLIIVLVALWSCDAIEPIPKPTADTGSLSFARFHAIGENFTAGIQNGGLVEGFQNVSVVAMVAEAAGAAVPEQPIVSENGIPPLLYVSDYSGPTIDQLPTPGTPTNTTYAGIYNNLGIPSALLTDLMTQGPAAGGGFALVLRSNALGGTAVSQMVNAQPTMAMAWVGINDVLGSALQGTDLGMTGAAAFAADYATMLDSIVAASGAVVTGNIPDVTDFPFFRTIPPVVVNPATREPVLDPGGNLIPLIGFDQGVPGPLPLNAFVLLTATDSLRVGVGIPVPVGGTGRPLPGHMILDPTEIAAVRQRVAELNTAISTESSSRGAAVADVYTVFKSAAASGAEIHGDVYTFDFLTGGLFGVDGVHPSALGYWLAAKQFVTAMNSGFGAAIPEPKLPVGPLRDPGLGQTSSNLIPAYSISWDEWQGVLSLFRVQF